MPGPSKFCRAQTVEHRAAAGKKILTTDAIAFVDYFSFPVNVKGIQFCTNQCIKLLGAFVRREGNTEKFGTSPRSPINEFLGDLPPP
jgi:hypothetical protein